MFENTQMMTKCKNSIFITKHAKMEIYPNKRRNNTAPHVKETGVMCWSKTATFAC